MPRINLTRLSRPAVHLNHMAGYMTVVSAMFTQNVFRCIILRRRRT